MLAEERFAMILDLLAQKRSATVLELCDALDASESTIRRDLTQLDRQFPSLDFYHSLYSFQLTMPKGKADQKPET